MMNNNYKIEEWDYSEDEDKLEKFIDFLRDRKKMFVIVNDAHEGVTLVGDDDDSQDQAKIICDALNKG